MGVKLKKRGAVWWVYIDWKGQRTARSLRVGDRRIAEKAARKIRERLASGEMPFGDGVESLPTFADYAEDWLRRAASRVRPSTMDDYRLAVAEATSVIGRKRLDEVRKLDAMHVVERMQVGPSGKRRSKATLLKLLAGLRGLFSDALFAELVAQNPFASPHRIIGLVSPAEGEASGYESHKEVDLYTHDERQRFLAVMERNNYMDFVAALLALRAGLRRSEVLALAWDDLDLDGRVIHIRRRLSRRRLGEPKSERSRRRVPMSTDLTKAVRRLKTDQMRRALEQGEPSKLQQWVFPSFGTTPGPLGLQSEIDFSARFVRHLRKALVRPRYPLPFHQLRHCFATDLLLAAVPALQVSRWLGHASIKMTVDTYGHLLPDAGEHEIVDLLDQLGASIRNKTATAGSTGLRRPRRGSGKVLDSVEESVPAEDDNVGGPSGWGRGSQDEE